MSTVTAAHAPPSLHDESTIFTADPDDLSVILAGIKLEDHNDDGDDDEAQASSLSAILQDVALKLSQVKDQFFIIQEKRHAGVFALAEQGSITASPSQSQQGDVAEKSVALDVAMAQLNSLLESISDGMKNADSIVSRYKSDESSAAPMAGFSPRRRTASIASLSSLDSFDDAFADMDNAAKSPRALKKRYEDLCLEWSKVQSEASTLEEELSSDKHITAFISICEQMKEMMDSLDKALASCHDFIFAMHRERAENVLTSSDSQWASSKERLADWIVVKRAFDVKKSSYGPACEQMFIQLQKGLAQKSIQNGTILRRLTDLKTRWRGLRKSVAKTDKELKRVEADLTRGGDAQVTPSKSSPSDSLWTPPRSGTRPKSRVGGKTDSATNTPTGMNHSVSMGDFDNDITPLRPSNTNSSISPNQPPAKPAKSIYRHSVIGGTSFPTSQQPHSRSFSSTATHAPPVSSSRGVSQESSNMRTGGYRSASGEAAHLQRASLATPTKYTRAGSEPPSREPDGSQRRGTYRAEEEGDMCDVSFSSATTTVNRPSSALGMYNRPASAAGFYYRPPSSNGHRDDADGSSRIPRLATGARHNDGHSTLGDRPGSALSFASSTAFGKSPSAKLSYTRSAYPPSSFRNNDHGNRLSMQTPEPTIAARAKRMNIFAPKASTATPSTSKRSSRPPPAKYNASVYGAGTGSSSSVNGGYSSSSSAGVASPSNYRIASTTTPLHINKRGSMAWSATGRTTPLSAAALAKVPHAGPDLGAHVQGALSEEKSSVITFRTQRAEQQSVGSRSYTPSLRSGRETPNFSDTGESSVWGGGLSRRMAAVYSYRANPNDAIDVEVGNIVNSLGMAIERVDPPLPRGVKDLTPASTKTVRYEVGGKVIVCKLLQLHRPASVHSNQDKTNKVLTRVGGGWIDLRQYLLSRMGTL